jgi:formylglycine-generating enzyme required for sulfatase activity
MKFVPVPGTKALFSIWETRVQDYEVFAKAGSANDEWQKQVKYGVPVTREPTEPVCGVAWQDAVQFCQWLTNKERAEGKLPAGMEYRLPMDEEWSRAIGLANESGTTPKERNHQDQSHFDCGASFPPKAMKVGNYADAAFHAKFPDKPWLEGYTDGFAMASPVGSFPPNEFGLYDLGGNVMEWCQDLFDPSGTDRFLRGTNWNSMGRDGFVSSHRTPREPLSRYPEHGFRVVLAPATSASPP